MTTIYPLFCSQQNNVSKMKMEHWRLSQSKTRFYECQISLSCFGHYKAYSRRLVSLCWMYTWTNIYMVAYLNLHGQNLSCTWIQVSACFCRFLVVPLWLSTRLGNLPRAVLYMGFLALALCLFLRWGWTFINKPRASWATALFAVSCLVCLLRWREEVITLFL